MMSDEKSETNEFDIDPGVYAKLGWSKRRKLDKQRDRAGRWDVPEGEIGKMVLHYRRMASGYEKRGWIFLSTMLAAIAFGLIYYIGFPLAVQLSDGRANTYRETIKNMDNFSRQLNAEREELKEEFATLTQMAGLPVELPLSSNSENSANNRISNFHIFEDKKTIIAFGMNGDIYWSEDEAKTWEKVYSSKKDSLISYEVIEAAGTVYILTSRRVLVSVNRGNQWQSSKEFYTTSSGINLNNAPNQLLINNDRIYITLNSQRLLHSEIGSNVWIETKYPDDTILMANTSYTPNPPSNSGQNFNRSINVYNPENVYTYDPNKHFSYSFNKDKFVRNTALLGYILYAVRQVNFYNTTVHVALPTNDNAIPFLSTSDPSNWNEKSSWIRMPDGFYWEGQSIRIKESNAYLTDVYYHNNILWLLLSNGAVMRQRPGGNWQILHNPVAPTKPEESIYARSVPTANFVHFQIHKSKPISAYSQFDILIASNTENWESLSVASAIGLSENKADIEFLKDEFGTDRPTYFLSDDKKTLLLGNHKNIYEINLLSRKGKKIISVKDDEYDFFDQTANHELSASDGVYRPISVMAPIIFKNKVITKRRDTFLLRQEKQKTQRIITEALNTHQNSRPKRLKNSLLALSHSGKLIHLSNDTHNKIINTNLTLSDNGPDKWGIIPIESSHVGDKILQNALDEFTLQTAGSPELDIIDKNLSAIIHRRAVFDQQRQDAQEKLEDIKSGALTAEQKQAFFTNFMTTCRKGAPEDKDLAVACVKSWEGQQTSDDSDIWTMLSTQLPPGILILFMLSTLGILYRYNLRLSGFYTSRAETLVYMQGNYVDHSVDNFSKIADILAADKVAFGKVETPVEQVVEIAKSVINKVPGRS